MSLSMNHLTKTMTCKSPKISRDIIGLEFDRDNNCSTPLQYEIASCFCFIFRDLTWVKIYNVDQRYEANRIDGECPFFFPRHWNINQQK